MKSVMLIVVATAIFAILCFLPVFFKWRKNQRELREKLLSRLSNRSDHLFYCLQIISDRYLARDTKAFIIEYLLSVISQLTRAHYQSEFVSKQGDLVRILTDLKLGQGVTVKE